MKETFPKIDIPDFQKLSKNKLWDPKRYQPMVHNTHVRNLAETLQPGTLEYDDFWDEMDYYCINGIEPKGMPRITGRHFYYMNFTQIEAMAKGTKRKKLMTPFYRDLDHWLFLEFEGAETYGYGLIIGKPRRVGLSEFGAVNVNYDLTFHSRAKAGIAAGKEDKAAEFYQKLQSSLENTHPAYRNAKLIGNDEELILGYTDTINKQKVKMGLQSLARIKTMFADTGAFEGGSYSICIFEEAGLFQNLQHSFTATKPCFMEGAQQFGVPLVYGCVCAGTKVWDNNGNLLNVEDLKQEQGIIGFKDGVLNKEPIIWMQPPSEKECVRITTNMGTVLECSVDHPILFSKRHFNQSNRIKGTEKRIINKKVIFKEAEKLLVGEQISMIDKVDVFSNKKLWQPRLIGLLIGDGSYGFDKTPVLSSCDYEVHDFISNFNVKIEKEYLTKDNKVYRDTRIKDICKNLREIGIYGQTKNKKRLPLNIHSYCKEDICELIGGFFDSDGHVAKKQINLTSSCFELLSETKLLLQKLGIHSGINKINPSKSSPKSKEPYFRLTVSSKKSLRSFIENINFLIKYKEENKLKLKEYAYSKNEIRANSIYTNGINFETVISVEKIGVKKIYNLNAGDSHTYIANGVITHNTGGEIDKGAKGYKELWDNHYVHGLKKIFVPAFFYYPGDSVPDEETGEVISFFDYDKGVTNREAAKKYIEAKRKIASRSKDTYIKHIQSYPLTESEIFIKTRGGTLDLAKLQFQLKDIFDGNAPEPVRQGRLEWIDPPQIQHLLNRALNAKERTKIRVQNECKVKFVEDGTGVVWIDSQPINQSSQHLSYKPDIGGCDSYDEEGDDKQGTQALSSGCVMAYRTFCGPTRTYNKPVGLLVERGDASFDDDTFYENAVKFAVYWDLDVLFEYSKILIIRYFYDVGAGEYVKGKPNIEEAGTQNHKNRDGVKMTKEVKPVVTKCLKAEVKDNIHKCYFENIIMDLMKYGDGNTDIAMTLGLCLLHRMDMFEEISDGIEYDYESGSGTFFSSGTSYYVDLDGNLRLNGNANNTPKLQTFNPERDLDKNQYQQYVDKIHAKENETKVRQSEHEKMAAELGLDQTMLSIIIQERDRLSERNE